MNMRPISITTTRWVIDASIPAIHCIIRAHDIRWMRKKQRRMILNCSLVSRITIASSCNLFTTSSTSDDYDKKVWKRDTDKIAQCGSTTQSLPPSNHTLSPHCIDRRYMCSTSKGWMSKQRSRVDSQPGGIPTKYPHIWYGISMITTYTEEHSHIPGWSDWEQLDNLSTISTILASYNHSY